MGLRKDRLGNRIFCKEPFCRIFTLSLYFQNLRLYHARINNQIVNHSLRFVLINFHRIVCSVYKGFHGFGQTKFAMVVQLLLLPQLPLKNDAWFKSGQNQLKNNQLASLI